MEKVLEKALSKFLSYLLIDTLLVLTGTLIKMIDRLLQYSLTFWLKIINKSCFRFFFEKINVHNNLSQCLFFYLITAIGRNHFSLIWQVQLFLISNDTPGLVNENSEFINWNVFIIKC